ncbi:MAG: hypothetical protein OEZ34_05235 [Spirochaetia bacterium]|nr:hypothetical protein [Spirochaetia bacterium]
MNLSLSYTHKFILTVFLTLLVYGSGWFLRSEKFDSFTSLTGFGCVQNVICFSELNAHLMPAKAHVFSEGGYDGQFYYYTAASLYSGMSAAFDDRALRLSRIGYPLLSGWVFPLFGPEILIIWMTILPLIVHLAVTSVLLRREEVTFVPVIFYALNPFSFLSFLLNVSDGLALSFAVLGIIFWRKAAFSKTGGLDFSPGRTSFWSDRLLVRNLILSFLFASFSLLVKETMIAVPAGMLAKEIYLNLLRFYRRCPCLNFYGMIFWAAVCFPLALWWGFLGYDFAKTASHGVFPFSGIFVYFQTNGYGETAKTILLIVFVVSGIVFLRNLILQMTEGESGRMEYFFMGLAALLLAAIADGKEYWSNFANISRLFTPLVLPYLFIRFTFRLDQGALPLVFFLNSVLVLYVLKENI